jgi:glutamate/tyrosine decarboxylase-like PLP-dependent enzyme
MADALNDALELAQSWLGGLEDRPVQARADLAALRRRFAGAMPQEGSDPSQVVRELARDMEDGLLGSAGGRFFAWVIGGGLEAALAADWLVSTWDQNAALYACGPSASVVEEQAGIWLKELFDLPREASFAFTTGCQLAHMTSLAGARHAVLKSVGWDVEQDGLIGAPDLKVLVNDQKHGSIRQAVNFLGLGQTSLIELATNDVGQVLSDGLRSALEAHSGPKILVLNAADLNVGSFDDYRTLIPMAKATGAWVHIDGAFGLFARTSAKYRYLTDGIDLADSWATDGHKWLNVPFDCGIAIVRDAAAHKSSMTISADYIAPAGAARDQIDWNPEWSRRARGVPVYAALRQLGRSGIEAMINRCCAHCAAIVEGIGSLPQAVVVARPVLNQGLVRFEKPGNTDGENDAFTSEVMATINATGEAFFSDTIWHGRRAMRVSVVNWRTSDTDVRRTIVAIKMVLSRL